MNSLIAIVKSEEFRRLILAGFFVSPWILFIGNLILEKQELDKMYTFSRKGSAIIDLVKENKELNLNLIFSKELKRGDSHSLGYLAWQSLAYWLALVYYKREYPILPTADSPIADFWRAVDMIFDGSACRKMEAFNEILNRSTAYLLHSNPYLRKKEDSPIKLCKMTQMIIDSYKDGVYESSRKK